MTRTTVARTSSERGDCHDPFRRTALSSRTTALKTRFEVLDKRLVACVATPKARRHRRRLSSGVVGPDGDVQGDMDPDRDRGGSQAATRSFLGRDKGRPAGR